MGTNPTRTSHTVSVLSHPTALSNLHGMHRQLGKLMCTSVRALFFVLCRPRVFLRGMKLLVRFFFVFACQLFRGLLGILSLRETPAEPPNAHLVARALVARYTTSGEDGLREGLRQISDIRRTLQRARSGAQDVDAFLEHLGDTLMQEHALSGSKDVLESAICTYDEVLKLRPIGHELHAAALIDLGEALRHAYIPVPTNLARLNDSINLLRQAVEVLPPGDPRSRRALHGLFSALSAVGPTLIVGYNSSGEDGLRGEVRLISEILCAVQRAHPGGQDAGDFLGQLGDAFMQQYGSSESTDMFEIAICIYDEILYLRPSGHKLHAAALLQLGEALRLSYTERPVDTARLHKAINLLRQAVGLISLGDPRRQRARQGLVAGLLMSFPGQSGIAEVYTREEVDLCREVLGLCAVGDPERAAALKLLAVKLFTRFNKLGDTMALAEAILTLQQALDLDPPHSSTSNNLDVTLLSHNGSSEEDVEPRVEVAMRGVTLELLSGSPPDQSHRSHWVEILGVMLMARFEHQNDVEALARAVNLQREAVGLHPAGHPNRAEALNKLATLLLTQFRHDGDGNVLTEAVDLNREALSLRPCGHHERLASLNNLAHALQYRFDQQRDFTVLAETIDLNRQALDLCPPGDSTRSISLNNLAVTLTTCFHQQGDLAILAEAIDLYRQALDLHQPEDLPTCMSNLANALLNRFQQQGDSKTLAEAMKLHRQALGMSSPRHPGRSMLLHNLADTLHIAAWSRMTSFDVLSEAIDLYRQALDLRPPGHSDRMSSLNGLANTLLVQFFQTRGLDVLQEAIVLFRQTMLLCPPDHPYHLFILANLGNAVRAQYQAQSLPHALEEELTLSKRGLDLCGDAHPQRVRFLFTIGDCQLLPGTSVFNFNDGIHHILEGLLDRTASARDRLQRVIVVLPVIEKAWQFVSEQKKTGLTRYLDCDDIVLDLYRSVIRLLPQAASLGLDSSGRLRELSIAETVSRNAATRAIWMQREQEAVEMLEEGRGVFWSQALRLRATSLDLLPAHDAQKLRGLFETLEDQHTRQKFVTVADAEWHVERRRRDGEAAETLIAEIRSYPGFERFLRPPEFSSLVRSLNLPPDSYVVIIVASALGHHALVLDRATGRANSIVLAPPERGFFSEAVRASLPRDGGIEADFNQEDYVSRPANISRKAGRKPQTLQDTLSQLWSSIAKPIVDLLGMEKKNGFERPRVWWCVTGELSFLPIHAAGETRYGVLECAADYFVSSYVPTLSALTKSRAGLPSFPRNEVTGILAACRNSPHQPRLDNVEKEVEIAMDCFTRASARILHSLSPNVSSTLLQEAFLAQKSAHVLHLACHGVQEENPLESAFLLSDGRVTIETLMHIHGPDALLAFLSACQTAKGSADQPDQAVHLAASMLFGGFRSVVGTMWSMGDEDGPKVARWFYDSLFSREKVNLDGIAYALDEAVAKLRQEGASAERWAVFIHIGG